MVNKGLRCLQRVNMLDWKTMRDKIKSQLIILAISESILVPEDNGNQNLNESCTNNYQKRVRCCYGYKLRFWVCIDDNFSKPFKLYLDKDAVYI